MSLYNLNHDYPPEWDLPSVDDWMEHQDLMQIVGDEADEILWDIYSGGRSRESAIKRLAEIIDTAFKRALEPEEP